MVDDEDYDYLIQFKWCYIGIGYAARGNKEHKAVRMHRELLGLKIGDGKEIDHINGNRLDNRKNNLRIVTPTQNRWNRRPNLNSKSGLKGVSWKEGRKKWGVQIRANKKRYYLGTFTNRIEAAKVYNKVAVELHGRFANINDV